MHPHKRVKKNVEDVDDKPLKSRQMKVFNIPAKKM